MFIVRTMEQNFKDGNFRCNDDTVLYILDTDDCIIERYSYKAFSAFKPHLNDLDVHGIMSDLCYNVMCKSILGGKVTFDGLPIIVNDKQMYKIQRHDDELRIYDKNYEVVVRIEFTKKLQAFRTGIQWVEQLGDKGYRITFTLIGCFEMGVSRVYIHALLDNEDNLILVNYEQIDEDSMIPLFKICEPNAVIARMKLLKGVVLGGVLCKKG